MKNNTTRISCVLIKACSTGKDKEMKATGIVRRIDDLGRIVLPKEIRRTLGVREGDPMEIFMDGDMVVLKKYNPADTYADQLKRVQEDISNDYDLSPELRASVDRIVQVIIDRLGEKHE